MITFFQQRSSPKNYYRSVAVRFLNLEYPIYSFVEGVIQLRHYTDFLVGEIIVVIRYVLYTQTRIIILTDIDIGKITESYFLINYIIDIKQLIKKFNFI